MGILNRKQHFCTICKKSISHRQKPKRRWNIEGFLCGDCYVDEMKKQYEIEEEIKHQNYEKNSDSLLKLEKIKVEKSSRSIKWEYYFGILTLIMSPILIISGLSTDNTFGWILGIIFLVIGIIQYPKKKKAMDALSGNESSISEKEGSPMAILKLRLAKGEITKEEFDKIIEDLKD